MLAAGVGPHDGHDFAKGYYAIIRAAIPHMARRGGGAIVNTSSASGLGHPSHAAYATAKEGLIGLTSMAAMEVGRFGIRCNAIPPVRDHRTRWLNTTSTRPGGADFMDLADGAKVQLGRRRKSSRAGGDWRRRSRSGSAPMPHQESPGAPGARRRPGCCLHLPARVRSARSSKWADGRWRPDHTPRRL